MHRISHLGPAVALLSQVLSLFVKGQGPFNRAFFPYLPGDTISSDLNLTDVTNLFNYTSNSMGRNTYIK